MLNDIVIAHRSEATRLAELDHPVRAFHGMDAKGVDSVKLGQLYSLLSDRVFDPNFMPIVAEGSEDGPWVQELPADLIRRLCDSSDQELESVASHWTGAFEKSRRVTAPETHSFLAELARLCRTAKSEGKSVLLWSCL